VIAGVPRSRPPSAEIRLRVAVARDRSQVLAWNSAPDVRARSLDPRPIDPVDHVRWFAARLADPLTRMWVIEVQRRAVGLVRIERSAPAAPGRISIVVEVSARRGGLGRGAIRAACRVDGGPIVAEIRGDNLASVACFESAAFENAGAAFDVDLGPPAPGVRRLVWRSTHV
jgi:RimJ/RimL family protein N-acetyltransferase